MNSVFSTDDLSDPFWQYPTTMSMDRSASERELAKLLEEVSSAPTTQSPSLIRPSIGENAVVTSQRLTRYPSDPIDSEEYHALLKSELERACAAVAKSRTLIAKPEEIPSVTEDQSLVSKNFQLGSQAIGTANAVSAALPVQSAAESRSIGNPALPAAQRKHDAQVRQTTSASSREDSDDDELEGDTGTNEHRDPADAKRARRMQSNRESARRSRRRKQAQLSDLETQVGQLRDERSTLLSRFTDINQRCDEAAVDNRILKADIETLRAKVKMAEEQVKRVTGLNPLLLARSNSLPNIGMQYVGGLGDPSMNVTMPVHPNSSYFHQPVHNIHAPASNLQGLNGDFSNNAVVPPLPTDPQMNGGSDHIGGLPSLQLPAGGHSMTDMASVPHQQKPFGPAVVPTGTGGLNRRNSRPMNQVANDNKEN